jgi:hypothetical protein
MEAPLGRIRPRTIEEAKILLDRVINDVDFAEAEVLAQDLNGLELVQEELELGQVVSGYQEHRDWLSNRLASGCAVLGRRAHSSMEAVQADYEKKFEQKQREQRAELDGLFGQWRAARYGVRARTEFDFDRSLEAATTIARDRRLKEAAKLRDEALHARTANCTKSSMAIDAHFKRRVAMMTERHRAELNTLMGERAQAIEWQLTIRDGAEAQAAQACELDNGDAIVSIRRGLKPGAHMPLSLTMQAARPRRLQTAGRGHMSVVLSDC